LTVGELIDKLQRISPLRRVMVRGYEGGFADVKEVELETMWIDCHKAIKCFGPHERVGNWGTAECEALENTDAALLL
jgi:hypothetical protein